MLDTFLREVVVILVGKGAEPIADLLNSKKHVNEFLIAKKLDLTINQTRNILYKIADKGLVSSIRKKDKKKGWYTYFWKIETLKALEFLREVLVLQKENLVNQITSRETKQFYVCTLCNVEFNEENALLKNFTCSECGNVFVLKDNSGVIRELKKNLGKIEKEMSELDSDIEVEKAKLEREIAKENKKEKKRKALARKKAASKRNMTVKKKVSKNVLAKKKSVRTKTTFKRKISQSKIKPKKKVSKSKPKKTSKKNTKKKSVKKKPAKKTAKKKITKKTPKKKAVKKTKKFSKSKSKKSKK